MTDLNIEPISVRLFNHYTVLAFISYRLLTMETFVDILTMEEIQSNVTKIHISTQN